MINEFYYKKSYVFLTYNVSLYNIDKIFILVPNKNFGGRISPLRFGNLWIVPHHSKKGTYQSLCTKI